MDPSELGAMIAERRRELDNMTQEQLAAAVGLSAGMIGHVESGRRSLGVEVLHRVLDALDVPKAERPAWEAARAATSRRLGVKEQVSLRGDAIASLTRAVEALTERVQSLEDWKAARSSRRAKPSARKRG